MKRYLFFCAAPILLLSACSRWVVEPQPYNLPAASLPSPTPLIISATPILLPPPVTSTIELTGTPIGATSSTQTPAFTAPASSTIAASSETLTPTPIATRTPTGTLPLGAQVRTTILSCGTGLDIVHGFGEVTNAYVTVANVGPSELDSVCAQLNALDEGRPHPDKTKCVPTLPASYQVTFKLTVDTTFRQATSIQVDVTSNGSLLERVGKDSCPELDLRPPDTAGLGTPASIP